MMTLFKRTIVALVLAALMLGGTAYAVDPTNPDDEYVASSAFIANIIAGFPELSLTAEQVQALRDSGYGWGEIVIACSIAVNAGQTLDGVMAIATDGAGWGEVATELGVETRAFGQYVREIIGRGGAKVRARHGRKDVDDAAAMDMAQGRFGLDDEDVQAMAAMGLDGQDVLCAVSVAAASGDASKVRLALELRVKAQSWLRIAEAAAVGKDGIVEKGVAIRNRIEFRKALEEQIKAQVRSQKEAHKDEDKGKPEDPGKGSGNGSGDSGGGAGDSAGQGQGRSHGNSHGGGSGR